MTDWQQFLKLPLAHLVVGSLLGLALVSTGVSAQDATPEETAPGQAAPGSLAGAATGDATAPSAATTSAPAAESGQGTANAQDGWPCMQRLQPELSIGAMWTGPDPTAAADEWRQDNAVQSLVSQIAPRRMPQQEAIDAIHRFASGYDKDKSVELTRLFAGLFETLNDERGAIIRGIRHFHDRQQKLADRIQGTLKAMDALDPNSTDQKVAEQRAALQDAVTWDSRIFDDREKLLPLVCDQPVVIERRLFALSRAIGAEMGNGN
jgi:hypothetical protein